MNYPIFGFSGSPQAERRPRASHSCIVSSPASRLSPPVIEIVARFRGVVVDVRHVRWTEAPTLSPRALGGAGVVLCALGLALALRGGAWGLPLLALGVPLVALAQVRASDRPGTRYVIGEGPGVDLTVALPAGAARDAFTLIVALQNSAVLGLPPGARGLVAGEPPLDIEAALAQGRRSIALPSAGKTLVELGELTLEITSVDAAVLEPAQLALDRLSLASHLSAAVLLGGLLWTLEPREQAEVRAAEGERFERVARYLAAIEAPKTPQQPPQPQPQPPKRQRVVVELPRPPEVTIQVSPDASPEELARAEADIREQVDRQRRGFVGRRDGAGSDYAYDRVAGFLGDERVVGAIDEFTVVAREGMRAYTVTKEDDVWWDKMTQGPPNMAKQFGGLELARTERGGGEHADTAPPKSKPKKVEVPALEEPPARSFTPEQEKRLRRFTAVTFDPPNLEAGAGLEKISLYHYAREHVEGVRACYDDALDGDPSLAGSMKVIIRFDDAGNVTQASTSYTTLTIGAIEPCVLKAIRRWHPAPPEPKPTKAVIQINFSSYQR